MSVFKKIVQPTLLISLLSLITSCTDYSDVEETASTDLEKSERWNNSNDPRKIGRGYIYNWDELNTGELQEGASNVTPWPGTYWPMQDDGYNYRWQGDDKLSPMELYDKAFNGWSPRMSISNFLALEKFSWPGTAYDQEYYDEMGPATAWAHKGGNKRARVLTAPDGERLWDETSNYRFVAWDGLQDWMGHCHAWAPASIVYPEPQHAVTVGGETFEVADIKALAEATMEGGRAILLGGRCRQRHVKRDVFGRIIAEECRDTNAGAFHVVTLNRIGIRKASFIMDVTFGSKVWNQPARDFKIIMQKEVEPATALELLGRSDVSRYPYNSDAKRFVHVKMDFRYIVEGSASAFPSLDYVDRHTRTIRYEYLLELDTAGTIIGGEWIDNYSHPDFIYAPYPVNSVPVNQSRKVIRKSDVQTLIRKSTSFSP